MYPSAKVSTYGTFVEHFVEQIKNEPDFNVSKTVMYKHSNKFMRIYSYLFFYMSIILKLTFFNYDVVYVHYVSHVAVPVNFVMKYKKVNVISNVHGSDVTSTLDKDKKFEKNTKKLLAESSKIVVPSQYMADFIIEKYDLLISKISIYPSGGVDDILFFDSTISTVDLNMLKKYGFETDKKIITYVSRIDDGKGWDLFVEAIELLELNQNRLEEYQFVMVGSGSKSVELYNKLRQLNLDFVNVIPSQPKEILAKIYRLSYWVVFPSQLPESLGLVGLEAMASGTPIIATNYAGIKTYCEDDVNGLLFELGNVNGLAEKILTAMQIPESKYEEMKRNAIVDTEKYLSSNLKPYLMNILNSEVIHENT